MVALTQLRKQLDFICEQPPSSLYREAPWNEVMEYWNVVQVLYHRCKAGLKVTSGPNAGLYMKKPSSMTVSCAELGKPLTGFMCDGSHRHLEGDGHPSELSQAQIKYCANDVLYLHKINSALTKILKREKRYHLYEDCLKFINTRVNLDLASFSDDIWSH